MKTESRFLRGLTLADLAPEVPPTDVLASFLADALPCQPDHPYLVKVGLAGASCQVYTGMGKLDGIQCHGAITIQISNADMEIVNAQLIVQLPDGQFKSLFVQPETHQGCFACIGPKPTDVVLVTTTWASSMSLHLATGLPVAVAFDAGNLEAVCNTLQARYPDVKLTVCADDDGKDGKTSTFAIANSATVATGAYLAVPELPANHVGRTINFNDLHQVSGLDAVRRCVEAATPPSQLQQDSVLDLTAEVERLAGLDAIQYEQQRTKIAKTHSIRTSFLDKLVAEERQKQAALMLAPFKEEASLFPEPVDGRELLSDLIAMVKRFTVLPAHAAFALALWVIHTYVINAGKVTPILGIFSPVMRCGKTTVLGLLLRLALRALPTSNITPAALFRCVEFARPTLLIDEGDTFLAKSPELNGIINSGHTRSTAFVWRVEKGEPQSFSTWCPKALAMIGEPTETLVDRTIPIRLRRKRANETVEQLRNASDLEFALARSKLARFSADNFENIKLARPALLEMSNDRASDNWEPLFAIALCIGQDCYETAVEAAIALSASHDATKSLAEELLYDIHYVFQSGRIRKITTVQLIAALCSDDEKPWGSYHRGGPITTRQLAGLIGKFDITSKNLRMGDVVAKGYDKADFEDAFARYVVNPSA